jgi:hypothetical protein
MLWLRYHWVQNRRDIQWTKKDAERLQHTWVINRIDELRFRTHADKHEDGHLYEDKIKMGNAGRNGGEYYPSSFD